MAEGWDICVSQQVPVQTRAACRSLLHAPSNELGSGANGPSPSLSCGKALQKRVTAVACGIQRHDCLFRIKQHQHQIMYIVP